MVNIDFLRRAYFVFDKPVPYQIGDKQLNITPIMLEQSEVFLSSIDILTYDKESAPDVDIIQMPYIEYMAKVISGVDELFADKLTNILSMCLGIYQWQIGQNEQGRWVLFDLTHDLVITAKKFDEISRILLYQNILHYDDEYVNPEVKKMMAETDSVRNFGKEFPTLERKIAIITAHTGIIKSEQMKMSFREHQGVFEECVGEVDFLTTRALMLKYDSKHAEHWIYKNKKGKYDNYVTSMGSYKKSFGGDGSISNVAQGDGTSHAEQLLSQHNL